MKSDRKSRITMIGSTHFDPVWLWTWDEGMSSIRSTFRAALDRMDEDPDFIYSFSCPPVFDWVLRVDPGLFQRIKLRVAEGRWELVEGWWLQPDCNLGTGESYARHGLYGQRYLMETFGKASLCAFNTDSFGHPGTLPQILSQSGIRYYVFGRPGPSEMELPSRLFQWAGPDGSSVLAWRDEDGAMVGDVAKPVRKAAEALKLAGHDGAVVYGVSNHGGAPTKAAIKAIQELSTDSSLPCSVGFGTLEGFFRAQDTEERPVVRGDLMTKWFGVFSNFPEIKQNNRRAEYTLLRAEKAAVAALVALGAPYPAEALRSAWKDLLFNQFHDIFGGACIPQAYFDARNLHGRVLQTANEILHTSVQGITKDIFLPPVGNEWNVVAWNLNAFALQEPVEAEVQWAWEFDWYKGPVAVVDGEGVEYCAIRTAGDQAVLGGESVIQRMQFYPAHGRRVPETSTQHEEVQAIGFRLCPLAHRRPLAQGVPHAGISNSD